MYANFFKRALDLIILFLVVPLAFVPMVLTAIISWIHFDKSIWFTQERVGHGGDRFKLFKFKSILYKYNNDILEPQITPWGKFIRQWSLDELPQLLNILRGEMSWVGPRPLLPEYLDYYSSQELKRHRVLPGLTGLAQINGRNDINWDSKLAFDVEYVNTLTLWGDIKILIKTVALLLSPGEGGVADSLILHRKGVRQSIRMC